MMSVRKREMKSNFSREDIDGRSPSYYVYQK
jgi:hypothetical protein